MLEGTHLAADAASESLAALTPSLAGGLLVGGVWTQLAREACTGQASSLLAPSIRRRIASMSPGRTGQAIPQLRQPGGSR